MSDRFTGHTFVDLKSVVVTSPNTKKSLDIRSIIQNIAIYGSIFDPTYTMEIVINDTTGMVYSLPMVGDEFVSIEIETPGRKVFERTMHCFNVADGEYDSNGAGQSYTLYCASTEQLAGITNVVDRGYNKSVSDIVNGILTSIIKTKQKVNIEKSRGIESLVVPDWNCLEAIEFCRLRAVSEKYTSPYLFFEDNTSFNFMSYDYLIEQRKKAGNEVTFTSNSFMPNAAEDANQTTVSPDQYRNAGDLAVQKKADLYDLINGGGFNSASLCIDLMEKTAEQIVAKYDDMSSYIKQPLEEKFNRIHGSFLSEGVKKPITQYVVPIDSTNKVDYAKTIAQRRLYARTMAETKIAFVTPGDIELQPGDIFTFKMPSRVNEDQEDQQLSGRYLLASLRHGLADGHMTTTIEAYRCGTVEEVVK